MLGMVHIWSNADTVQVRHHNIQHEICHGLTYPQQRIVSCQKLYGNKLL